MIFDGLDEFTDQDATRLLRLIGQSCATLPTPVRFIITSRPEPHLLHQYDSEPLDSLLHIRSLDLEDVGEVEKDIEAFLKQELPQMVWGLVKQPSNWPGEERRIALIRLSGGLWIWVVTVARMLADRKLRDPEKQLNTLLLSASDMDGEYGHNTDLYAIYSQIMNRACPQDSHPELITLFRGVLGALCVAEAPINTHTLTSLLCLDYSSREDFADSMRTKVLEYLQAVLIIPDIEEDDPSRDAKPIQFVHKSFKDYLTDKKRCEARFLISIAEQQRWMAIRCLRRMEDLQKPNICDINPSNLNSEIGNSDDSKHDERLDIKGLIRLHISSTLQYACENWANHVSNTSPECDDVYAAMDMFTRTRLMYWLEVLSLLEMTNSVKFLVGLVEVWLKARPQQVVRNSSELPTPTLPCRIATFMIEGLVKIQAGIHFQMNTAHASPDPLSLRVRNYARRLLPEIPPVQQSRVSLQANSLPKESDISSLSLLQDLESFVNEFRIPISTSSPHIYHSALPFTPSHTSLSQVYSHLAEGGPKPRREHLQQWTPQIAQSCVAWSPDGEMIISGYYDGSLRLWDPSTGAPIGEAWKFHTNAVDCVAWSPNGKMIASGSIVRFQFSDPITGAHIGEAWEDVTSAIISIAWSPDSKWVVTGSMDRTVRIWDSPTRAHVTIAHRTEFVRCVTWSPDGRRIASGHDDGLVIHLWDPSLGAVVEKLWEVGDSAYGLAWSPDGNMIVSSSMYGTLRLWHAWTGEMIAEPTAGMDDTGSHAWCVAWSPDGTKIVSSHDATVRLWNASTREPVGNAWQGHTDDVRSLGWSADGQTVVSGSEDGTILWNYLTGDPVRLEQGGPDSHTRHVYRLAFAPNSNKIVTASFDGSLRLWDSSSGVLVEHPICQTAAVISLNFSLDEKYVISETNECRILWRVAGEETGLVDDTQVEPVSDAHSCVLKIDTDGWIRDPRGKGMFWLPDVLRPIGNWGRVVVNGNILAIEVPSIPIIDISAYASRF
ncbi:hypothetical protein FRB93_008496 [Tulasnella sp. JGI-2019a]|nr:hypothetical protein FRB93_008496 [Tulasnella sp. JGI-2019a]